MELVEPRGGWLLQGDICLIKGLPSWNLDQAQAQVDSKNLLSKFVLPPVKGVQWDELSGEVAVAVCSHDCDIENPRTRTGIVLAPLVKVPAKPSSDEFDRIMASGDTWEQLDYINLFPLRNGTDGDAAVVDLSNMVTASKAEVAIDLLRSKRLYSLSDDAKENFRRKIALFFSRPYQEVRSEDVLD